MFVPLTPVRFLYRAMDQFGNKVGVVCGERRFTYAEFGERCERLAAGLAAAGVRAGDRVAYLSFNNHALLEGYFGVPLARGVLLPLNVRLTPAELAEILCHAEPRILIYEPEFTPAVEKLQAVCPSLEQCIEIGAPYEELLACRRIERPDPFSFDEGAPAELFYTSGSTGTPKGVVLAHRTLYLHALSVAAAIMHDACAVELHTIPLFHANGWGRPHAATMLGLRQVMVRRFEPTAVLRLIEQERATGMALVPTMANALLNCPELGRYDVSSVTDIMLGGAASSPELIARLESAFPCKAFAGYGLTETSPVVTVALAKSTVEIASPEEGWRRRAMTGWAVPGTEIRVVDLEMNDVTHDMCAVGEVVVRGDTVMDGYYKDPRATDAALTEGWLHTGDMAVWDEDGYVQIVDRKKDIIVSGGENISSIEIERAIGRHPAVLECAVVAAPDPQWGEAPAAIVSLKPDRSLNAEELARFLETRIARFKMPRRYEFTNDPLPKTGTGKIVKRALREPLWQGKERRVQG
jgi:fatty-acyl-CoA synthase